MEKEMYVTIHDGTYEVVPEGECTHALVPIRQLYGLKKALRIAEQRKQQLQGRKTGQFKVTRTGEHLTPGRSYGTQYETVVSMSGADREDFPEWWDSHCAQEWSGLDSQGTRAVAWVLYPENKLCEVRVIHDKPLDIWQ